MVVLITGLQATGKSTVADRLATRLNAPVFSWDWCMAALTPFDSIQRSLAKMNRDVYRSVGWSLMWQLSRPQLRRGMNVVLDGMVTDAEVTGTRRLAEEHDASLLLVLTTCRDEELHRRLVEGRRRDIPGWHELTWRRVEQARQTWNPPDAPDVVLDAGDSIDHNMSALVELVTK